MKRYDKEKLLRKKKKKEIRNQIYCNFLLIVQIGWAIEDGNDFKFDNIIYITMFGHDDPEGMNVGKQKKKAKKEIKKNWFKVEDAIYFKVYLRYIQFSTFFLFLFISTY